MKLENIKVTTEGKNITLTVEEIQDNIIEIENIIESIDCRLFKRQPYDGEKSMNTVCGEARPDSIQYVLESINNRTAQLRKELTVFYSKL